MNHLNTDKQILNTTSNEHENDVLDWKKIFPFNTSNKKESVNEMKTILNVNERIRTCGGCLTIVKDEFIFCVNLDFKL